MQPQFYIEADEKYNAGNGRLALQIGSNYFGYSVSDVLENKLLELGWYPLSQLRSQPLNIIVQNNPALHEKFDTIIIAFDFNTYTLLPTQFNNGDNNALMYLNGADQQDHIITEAVGQELNLLYTVPYSILNWCVKKFTGASYWHLQTARIKSVDHAVKDGIIAVSIGTKYFNVVVAKDSRLLLAQTYAYQSPADMLFYLLKICETFSLSQNNVQLQLCGLVDKDSSLYKTLYDYFLKISLIAGNWIYPDTIYPAHYFTTLYQVGLCGSLQEI